MSQDNVETVRRCYSLWESREWSAIPQLFDPKIEIDLSRNVFNPDVYHGHDGVRKWHREFRDVWGDEFRVEPEAYFDFGDQTLAFIVARGRGKQSGAEVAMPAAQVARWRDGLCAFFKAYRHREDALTELGVYEDGLEPIEP